MTQKVPKSLPIGISDYKKLILNNCYYVDKTLLIQEIWNAGEVVLMPRPRRFGKTINLSMMRYFFEKADTDYERLFGECNLLQQHPEYRELMGKFPVIFITFKDVGRPFWQDTYIHFKLVISAEFSRHRYLVDSLEQDEKEYFLKILDGSASNPYYAESLKFLSKILCKYYGAKVIVLIDEYDAPLHAGYLNNYYPQVVDFARTLYSSVLKDNNAVEKSFVTGILAVAKEGMFSGLNNLNVLSITKERAANCFGFTPDEVGALLEYYEMNEQLPIMKDWYNGYQFGNKTGIYNPWSVLNCVENKGAISAYWANTSNDGLIKRLLSKESEEFKVDFATLLQGGHIEILIDESIIMPELDDKPGLFWSLLFYAGYLTFTHHRFDGKRSWYALKLPNQEVMLLFEDLISDLVARALRSHSIQSFMRAVSGGDLKALTALMQEFISSSISIFDIPQNDTERSYHLFVLGLLVSLRDHYNVKSNRESGDGRYDVMLIPLDKAHTPIIIEFKKSDSKKGLSEAADAALQQIKDKRYAHDLQEQGFNDYRAYAMAFYRKDVLIKMESQVS